MAQHLLGLPVDLHGGGPDLIYPHHYAENEVSLTLRGRPFSHIFLYPGFVLIGGAKMSKSVGRLIPLREALRDVGASPLRWYLLSTSLAKPLKWDPRDLHAAAKEHEILRRTIREWIGNGRGGRGRAASATRLSEEVRRALAHGLATDRAFARLRAWAATVRGRPELRLAPSERARARRAFRAIEGRTGLSLL